MYNLGLTGIPITNVNNNCATGSTALHLVNAYVKGGLAECGLALGFERMTRGSISSNWKDRSDPLEPFNETVIRIEEKQGDNFGPHAPRMFANAAQEYFDKYGANIEHLAKIGETVPVIEYTLQTVVMSHSLKASKNHKHSLNNPYSQFRDGWSVEDILKAPKICKQLTKYMCSPTSDGGRYSSPSI